MKRMTMAVLAVLLTAGYASAQEQWRTIKDPRMIFEVGYIQVVGSSEEGQTRFRAIRAAEVIAQRQLLEVVQGIDIYGTTSVQDGMLQSDVVRTKVEGFLRGAVKVDERFYPDRGYAEVAMRLYIRGKNGMYEVILPLLEEQGFKPEPKPQFRPQLTPQIMQQAARPELSVEPIKPPEEIIPEPEVAKPSEIALPFDGLIVDTRDHQFRPALLNRILTEKGEVVFDPSKVVSNILVERGSGGFTTDTGKAKALLETWGCTNPMLIKAATVVKFTDVEISADDAAAVFVHDQKSNLLAQSRVVFLLK